MRIRAAVLHRPGNPVTIEDVELDPRKAGEVLVRVVAAGVCHSDVRYADGELGERFWPIVLGHEGAGVVEQVGEGVTGVEPGDHVAFCFVPACRACRYCLAGKPNLCELVAEHGAKGMLLDGTSRLRLEDGTTLLHGLRTACFAERTVVAAGGAVSIPRELPLWQAALLGCGVVTGMGAVRNAADVRPGDSVAVIGCGGVGLQVVAAARLAGAHEFVSALPEGYETMLGEAGLSLSGGQRQRIAIARAILANPRVLVLDDATSAVDPTKEHEIRDALEEVTSGTTTIIIGHRPATIALADRVLLIEGGKVAAEGPHEELLASSPAYRTVLAQAEAAEAELVEVTVEVVA